MSADGYDGAGPSDDEYGSGWAEPPCGPIDEINGMPPLHGLRMALSAILSGAAEEIEDEGSGIGLRLESPPHADEDEDDTGGLPESRVVVYRLTQRQEADGDDPPTLPERPIGYIENVFDPDSIDTDGRSNPTEQ